MTYTKMASEDKDLDRPSLLLNAARKGDVEDVKELLSDGLYPDSPLTQSGRTLLHVTAHHGHLDVLVLVAGRYKVDPNVVNKSGHTPLHEACAQGRTSVIHFLLSIGAWVDIAAKDRTTSLMLASHGGHVTTAKVLIAAGADVNVDNLNGWTALHYGAYKGNIELVKLLLHHGCDVDKLTSDGKWAGALAEEEGHDLCAEELKKARGLVSMAAEARIAALEGRLALVEESKRRLTEENTRLESSKVEDVHTQYQDLLSSLKEQLLEKESEIANLRQLKCKEPRLLPKMDPKQVNSAPSSPHPLRKVYKSPRNDNSGDVPSRSEEETLSSSPDPSEQVLSGRSITELVELSLNNPNCMSAIKKEIKSDQLTPKIKKRFRGKSGPSPLVSDSSPHMSVVTRQPSDETSTVAKQLTDSTDGTLPRLV